MYSSVLRKHKVPLIEDLLTAAFFDLVRCFRDWGTLEAAFACAQSRHGTLLHLPEFDDVRIELWPNLLLGEPDVRLTFLSNHRRVAIVIVEAKLGAAKSGRDAAAGEEVKAPESADLGPVLKNRDQLARYMASQASMQSFGGPQFLGVVYLTHHAEMPNLDLEESENSSLLEVYPHLRGSFYWLSWRDVEAVIPRSSADAALQNLAKDLMQVLRLAGLFRFRGFRQRALVPPGGPPWRYAAMERFVGFQILPLASTSPRRALRPFWRYPRSGKDTAKDGRAYIWPRQHKSIPFTQFAYERRTI